MIDDRTPRDLGDPWDDWARINYHINLMMNPEKHLLQKIIDMP